MRRWSCLANCVRFDLLRKRGRSLGHCHPVGSPWSARWTLVTLRGPKWTARDARLQLTTRQRLATCGLPRIEEWLHINHRQQGPWHPPRRAQCGGIAHCGRPFESIRGHPEGSERGLQQASDEGSPPYPHLPFSAPGARQISEAREFARWFRKWRRVSVASNTSFNADSTGRHLRAP